MIRARALSLGTAIAATALAAFPNPPDGAYCTADTDCGHGDVCAHSHECLPPSDVHSITIRWTIDHQPAKATSCAGIDHLDVGYEDSTDATSRILFSPVSCVEGLFPNDKWPIRFDTADVFAQGPGRSTSAYGTIPPDANVDLTVDVHHP